MIVLREPCVKKEICSIVAHCQGPPEMTDQLYSLIEQHAADSVMAAVKRYRPEGQIRIPMPSEAMVMGPDGVMTKVKITPKHAEVSPDVMVVGDDGIVRKATMTPIPRPEPSNIRSMDDVDDALRRMQIAPAMVDAALRKAGVIPAPKQQNPPHASIPKQHTPPASVPRMKKELEIHSKRALDCPGCSGGGCDDFTRRVKEIIEAYGFCLLEDQINQAIADFDITSKVIAVITNNAQSIVNILTPQLNILIKQQVLNLILTDTQVINALVQLIIANSLSPTDVLNIVTGAVNITGPLNTALVQLILDTAGGGVDPAQVVQIVHQQLITSGSTLYDDVVAIINAHQSCCPVDPAQVQTIVNNLLTDNTSSTYQNIVNIIQANPVCCPLDVPAVIAVIQAQYLTPQFTTAVLNVINANPSTIENIVNTFLTNTGSTLYQTILNIINQNPPPLDPIAVQQIVIDAINTIGNPLRDLLIQLILANQTCCPINPAELIALLQTFLTDPANPIYQLVLAIAETAPVDPAQVQQIILTQLQTVGSPIYQAVYNIAVTVPVDPAQVQNILNQFFSDPSNPIYQLIVQIIQSTPLDPAQVEQIILQQLNQPGSPIYNAVLNIALGIPIDPIQIENILNQFLTDPGSTVYNDILQIIQNNPPSCDNVIIIPTVLQQIVDQVIAQITSNNCPNMITVNSSASTTIATTVAGVPLALPFSSINTQFSDLGTGFIGGPDLSIMGVPTAAMYEVRVMALVSGAQPFPATFVNIDLIATYNEPPASNLFTRRAVYCSDGNIRGMINLEFTMPMVLNSNITFTLASNLASVNVEEYSISIRPVVNL